MAGPRDFELSEQQLGYVLTRVGDAVDRIERAEKGIRESVSLGVQDGIKALAADHAFRETYWKAGFDHLSEQAASASSQWIGKRILTAAVLAVVSAGVAWLVKTGKL